ncbi:ABC transporter permease [Clostridia bacterium]|nr:ABC transporter permease [Clostridia bacterium]
MKKPPIHIVKREDIGIGKALLVRLLAILLGLIVCALLIFALTGLNPIGVYASLISGAVGTMRRTWMTIRDALILLLIAVGLTPAFRMRFWNIGAEGQVLTGAVAAAAIMIYFNQLPPPVLLPLMLLASLIAGMAWGLIPALCKVQFGTNETLLTLMLNYIAMQIVNVCIVFWENPKGSNTVGIINSDTKAGWLPPLFGLNYGWNVVIALLITAGMYFYLKYTKQGYEIAVVGESENTARYAGISVKRVVLRTMAVSGAICGIAGFLIVSGASQTISVSTGGGRGFTAIIVSFLAQFNAFAMIPVSVFLVFMQKGAIQIASQFSLNDSISDVITGILLFFLIGCEFFIRYKISFAGKSAKQS